MGNTWLKELAVDEPAVLLQAVTALSKLRRMAVALAPPDEALHDITVSTADRALAGFNGAARGENGR